MTYSAYFRDGPRAGEVHVYPDDEPPHWLRIAVSPTIAELASDWTGDPQQPVRPRYKIHEYRLEGTLIAPTGDAPAGAALYGHAGITGVSEFV